MSDAAAKRRARQTVNNLALSLLATLGIVLVLVLIVPRDDSNRIPHVDYQQVAQDAAASSGQPIVAPALGKGWWANKATWATGAADGIDTFEVGLVSPVNHYIAFKQGFGTNPTWVALQLVGSIQTGTIVSSGIEWQVWESVEQHDPPKSKDYVLVASIGNDTAMIYGTADKTEFETFRVTVSKQLKEVY
ncbi:MAG: hypothetical protein RLZ71_203 [Actinomycetota bacterium]